MIFNNSKVVIFTVNGCHCCMELMLFLHFPIYQGSSSEGVCSEYHNNNNNNNNQ